MKSRVNSNLAVVAILVPALFGCGEHAALAAENESGDQPVLAEERFEELRVQLDSNLFRERKTAFEQLLQQGPAILPLIYQSSGQNSPAVDDALDRLKVGLEKQMAVLSFEPNRLSFNGEVTLKQVLRELEKQTGNQLNWDTVPAPLLEQKKQVEFSDQSFWEVMTGLEKEFGFFYHDSIRDSNTDLASVGTQSIGSVRVLFGVPSRKKLAGQTDQFLFRIPVSFQFEPRVRVLYMSWKGSSFKLKNNTGREYAPFNPQASLQLSAGASHEINSRLDYIVPASFLSNELTQLSMEGNCQVMLAAGEQELEFPLSRRIQNTKRSSGLSSATVLRVRTVPQAESPLTRVRLRVNYEMSSAEAFESHRTWMFHDPVWIQEASGKVIPRLPLFRTLKQRPGEITVAFDFPVSLQDLEQPILHYLLPTSIQEVTLEIPPTSLDIQ